MLGHLGFLLKIQISTFVSCFVCLPNLHISYKLLVYNSYVNVNSLKQSVLQFEEVLGGKIKILTLLSAQEWQFMSSHGDLI